MHRLLILGAATLLLGCNPFEDNPDLLLGTWGGPNMQVTGTPSGAIVLLPCEQSSYVGPLRLDQPGGFTATGVVTRGTSQVGVTVRRRVIVRESGGAAVVQLQVFYRDAWQGNDTYRVVRGQPVSYPDGRLCGL